MPGNILIYVEHDGGLPRRTALEAASKATELSGSFSAGVAAVGLGRGAAGLVDRLGQFGVDTLYVSEDEVFDQYLTEPAVEALTQVIERERPICILFPDTADSKDIASRLATRLQSGLVAAVVDLVEHNGHLDAIETIFGGNYTTNVECRAGAPAIYLIRPNAFTPAENRKSTTVQQINVVIPDTAKRVKKGNLVLEEGAPAPLEEANVIVSGGRGLGGPEPFSLLAELAEEVNGSVGASRAAVDAGWISYSHQVGQTGRTVKPQLYFAIGISGAVQHRVGMQTADTVVAINRDADAPIFQLADLAVVGDLFKIVPALTQEIRKRKGE
ncbi:MAG: electron transfer flavoprotein subunit alpha/FixB family protein [Chloroflexota bacterium]|nr:electron transfer flavoprotein subunit alpha/FixB family protein [Chloroflexota bacterium]